MHGTPEFYTGAPVDPYDRGVAELWETLRTKHLVLTPDEREKPASWITCVTIPVSRIGHDVAAGNYPTTDIFEPACGSPTQVP